MDSQPLDIGDQMAEVVVLGFAQRRRTPGAALVEHHDAVEIRIEETAVSGGGAGARAAVEKDHRHARGIARLLPIHRVQTVERERTALIGLDGREQVLAAESGIIGHDQASLNGVAKEEQAGASFR